MTRKSVKLNIIFNMLRVCCGILFPLISFPYAAHILGVENIGKIQFCNSVVNYFILFAGLGINIYAAREGVRYRDNKDKLSKFAKEIISISFISTTISYLCLLLIIRMAYFKEYEILLLICSTTIALTTFNLEWLYQIIEEIKYITLRTVSIQILSFTLLICFVRDKNDYVIYAVISALAVGGNCFVNIYHSRKIINWRKKYIYDVKRHFYSILTIFSVSLSTSIYLSLDTVMIGVIRNDVEVGLYSAAVKFNSVVKTIITSISTVLLSRLSYYVIRNKNDLYENLLRRGANVILALVIPSCLGIILLNQEILFLFCGTEFLSASFACIVLSINMIFSVIDGMLYNQVCLPHGLEKNASKATVLGALANLMLNIFFIDRWGFNGAAVTTLVSEFIVFIVLIFCVKSTIDLKYIFGKAYRYIFASGVMFLLIYPLKLLDISEISHIILTAMIGVIIYGLCLYLQKDELVIEMIKSMSKSVFEKINKLD